METIEACEKLDALAARHPTLAPILQWARCGVCERSGDMDADYTGLLDAARELIAQETNAKTYNGWSNYETWCVALWMDNDQGSYEIARETARECAALDMAEEMPMLADYYADADNAAQGRITKLADSLKEWHSEMEPDLGASLWADMLSAAFAEVNWREIAEHLMDEIAEASPA